MQRITLAVFAAALTFLGLSTASLAGGGCHSEMPALEGSDPNVKIAACAFQAAILRVPVGTRVTWTNAEQYLPHVISGIGWGRTESMLNPGDTFSHDFTQAGIYPYTCTLHPGMSAVVMVGDVVAPPSSTALKTAAAPQRPAENGPDGTWFAVAFVAVIGVGVSSFTAGRHVSRS